ncbi:MAG: DNA methyltransferase [Nanoarchaeota archaeon]|nr:DNA methyltransferase [Nanoarchaeota archaeon]
MESIIEFKKGGQADLGSYIDKKIKSNMNISPIQSLDKIKWDFKDSQTQYLTHKYHSYPARFIPQIPRAFIQLFTKEGDTILDPFCGCGTTLVESTLLKRHSIGNDFNPLATLLSKVKTTSLSDQQLIKIDSLIKLIEARIKKNNLKESDLPELPSRNISKLFSKEMLKELQVIKNIVKTVEAEDKNLHNYLLIALSATIRAIIESENGDNILGIFERKLNQMNNLMREYRETAHKTDIKLINGDARKLDISSESVDLIVTSPPYVNALDYYRVHMYNMLWLGMDYNEFKINEIGGHSHFLANRFRLLAEYLGDMLRAMIEMNRVLKDGKYCAIVVGNSSIDYEMIESYKHFISMAKYIGFEHIKTIFRNINKSSKYFVNGKIDDEYIVVLRKIKNSEGLASDEDFIAKIVLKEMQNFRSKVEKKPGSSTRGKEVSAKRLKYNLVKIDEAIEKINKDIKIKGN